MGEMRNNLACIATWMEENGYGTINPKGVIIMVQNPDMNSELMEIKIGLYFSEWALSLLAYAPIMLEKNRQIPRILNQMNLSEADGQFQYEEDGSLLWSCRIMLPENGIGNEVLNKALEIGCRNAGRLYATFMNMDADDMDMTNEQEG